MKTTGVIAACAAAFLLLVAGMIEMVVADPLALPLELFHTLAPYNSDYEPGSFGDGTPWLCPVAFDCVSSPFGYRIHPISGDWRLHEGIDLGAPEGETIVAARDGVVTAAAYDDSSGNYVIISHGNGFSSAYLHMASYIVSVGDEVRAGDTVGYVGSTGASTGPHLHFSIYYNGESIDPAIYVDFSGSDSTEPPGDTTPEIEPGAAPEQEEGMSAW